MERNVAVAASPSLAAVNLKALDRGEKKKILSYRAVPNELKSKSKAGDNCQRILTNLTSLASLAGRTNAPEISDAVDARRALCARL